MSKSKKNKWTSGDLDILREIPPAYAINAVSLCTPYHPGWLRENKLPTSYRATLTLCGVSYDDPNSDTPSNLLYVSAMYTSNLDEDDYEVMYPPTESSPAPLVKVGIEEIISCIPDGEHPMHGVVSIPFSVLGSKVVAEDGDSFHLAPSVIMWQIWAGDERERSNNLMTGAFTTSKNERDQDILNQMRKQMNNLRTSDLHFMMGSVEKWIVENNNTTQALMDDKLPPWMNVKDLIRHLEDAEEEGDADQVKRMETLRDHPHMLVAMSETTAIEDLPGLLLYPRLKEPHAFGYLQSWRGQLFMTIPSPRFADGINHEVMFGLEHSHPGWTEHWDYFNAFGISREDAVKFVAHFTQSVDEHGKADMTGYEGLVSQQKATALNLIRVLPVALTTVMMATLTATPIGASALQNQPHQIINVVTGIPIGDGNESTIDAIRNSLNHSGSQVGLNPSEIERAIQSVYDNQDTDDAPPEERHVTDFDVDEVDDDDFKAIWG